jgi:hypothetical protein
MPNKQTKAPKPSVKKTSPEQLIQEADDVREMIGSMSKNVQPKSEWFIVSQSWINKW